jgi:hypothetical protein
MTPKGVRRAVRQVRDAGIQRVAEAALAAGYTGRRSTRNHLILYAPDGVHRLSIVLSGVDPRAWRNLRAEARRQGLDVV